LASWKSSKITSCYEWVVDVVTGVRLVNAARKYGSWKDEKMEKTMNVLSVEEDIRKRN
jgi:hypothetical protein